MAGTQEEPTTPALNNIPELPASVANSLLFELPREIRDRIYSLCLMSRETLPVEWPRPRDAHTSYDLQPQLLRTCRVIHNESAALLYTLNNMTFHHPSDANMFVRAIASSMHSQQVTNLSLHIKAQDMRLWMPYITSTDESRSLKADFPNLRELGVRFRSNKWAHQHTPDSNLKTWHEDSRLDEVIDGLRHVFRPENLPEPISEREFQEYMARNPTAFQEAGDNYQFRKRLLELQKARANTPKHRHDIPVVRVCCACRVHSAHFSTLTEPRLTDRTTAEELPPPVPVREGEEFHGFTAIDLQNGVKRLHDPDLGSANVARTPYANKHGVLIALEIHCLDPKKDPTERTA
ncbi:hypothetical protein DOTSEDRAFT_69472 [Dothistroma septosporum NZE10]|uniref:F-box domain-containing protein n=1 Tax=Dothistroma septosporum (strain NZE10 / CBS 128990) TaxID=675120 RepID=N1PVX0_DOTSN|nr:hypothetical protein DOTSEDRAFT_69472 [Dothistroma septosporum NZE10]